MLAPARRLALLSSKSAAYHTVGLPVCAPRTHTAGRYFHATPSSSLFKAAWKPMRVKTPWVDALAQSQVQAGQSASNAQEEEPMKPDLTPRKMSDSYFSAVSRNSQYNLIVCFLY